MPTFPRGTDGYADTSDVAKGGYVLLDADGGAPDVVLIGTGSEVQIAVAAREQLAADGIRARVVSMPCREWFDEQDKAYRDSVIPPTSRPGSRVEAARRAGLARDRRRLRPDRLASSTSAPPPTTSGSTPEFGLTAEAVAAGRQGQHRRRRGQADRTAASAATGHDYERTQT